MKGSIDLFVASIVFIAIILVVSLVAFSSTTSSIFGWNCEYNMLRQISELVDKMSLPSAQTSEPITFRVYDCVEYIDTEKDEIKFKSSDKPQEIRTSESIGGQKIDFEYASTKVSPRDSPYSVILNPPNRISISG